MDSPPDLRLDHINLPAKRPSWLAEWYAENFDLRVEGTFVIGAGIILVFEQGEPADYGGKAHFGFRCASRDRVAAWAGKFEAALVEEANYCGFETSDPEGNRFKVYWEAS